MTKLTKTLDARRKSLLADCIDIENIDARLEYEAKLYQIKLTDLIDEYRQGISREYVGWRWRALHHVLHHRAQRLERKDHTRLK